MGHTKFLDRSPHPHELEWLIKTPPTWSRFLFTLVWLLAWVGPSSNIVTYIWFTYAYVILIAPSDQDYYFFLSCVLFSVTKITGCTVAHRSLYSMSHVHHKMMVPLHHFALSMAFIFGSWASLTTVEKTEVGGNRPYSIFPRNSCIKFIL